MTGMQCMGDHITPDPLPWVLVDDLGNAVLRFTSWTRISTFWCIKARDFKSLSWEYKNGSSGLLISMCMASLAAVVLRIAATAPLATCKGRCRCISACSKPADISCAVVLTEIAFSSTEKIILCMSIRTYAPVGEAGTDYLEATRFVKAPISRAGDYLSTNGTNRPISRLVLQENSVNSFEVYFRV